MDKEGNQGGGWTEKEDKLASAGGVKTKKGTSGLETRRRKETVKVCLDT